MSRDPAQPRSPVSAGESFELPFGEGAEVHNPGPQRVAVYERTKAERGASLRGRRDF